MRRHALLTGLVLLLTSSSILLAQDSAPLTNESIIELVTWHFSNEEIISAIKRNPAHFDLSPQALAGLAANGVANPVIAAMRDATSPSATTPPSGTGATPDEVIFVDGASAKGKILFVQCAPGTDMPVQPAIQFQSTDIQAKTTIPASAIRTLLLAGGGATLSVATDPTGPIPAEVVDYLRDHPGSSSPLSVLPSRPSVNLAKALVATCTSTDHYWVGDISASGAYAVGTQSQKQIGGAIQTSYARNPNVYNWNYQIARLDLEAKYTEALKVGAPSIKSQEIYYGELNYSFHPDMQWSPYAISRLYHNYSLGLALGQIYGVGLDYKIKGLSLSGGFVGITDRLYAPGNHFSSAGARVYESYASILPLGKITWFESIEIFPAFQLAKAIQGRGIVGFGIPLSQRIQIIPKFADDYLGNAPPHHRFNYSNTSLSLDFKLGRNQ